ncbi:MAG: hypothetical protein KDA29_02870 [Phycisphaerales bacterium]|nr:hypothetical protein [Phycisphaerales bacterium]
MFEPQYTITHACEAQDPKQDTRPEQPDRVSCFFPSQRGVVEFQSHDNTTLLLAATGHLRDFIAQRLNETNEPSARADLAPITARILAHPTGSAFESDLFVLERARTADPELYRKIAHQNRRALLAMDPEQGTWRVCETSNPDLHPQEHIVGPCFTSKGAQQLGEALDDLYELCRFPAQLALAPNGTPCAYKEMGRCPAACDGSEPMQDYHERFNRAIASASEGIDAWSEQIAAEIKHASAELDFESASRLKPTLDTIKALPRDQLGHARSMHTFACLIITPASRPGWALCWLFNALGCNPLCSIGLLDNELLESLPALLESHRSPIGFDQDQLDRFSLIARHWLTKPSKQRKRRVSVLDMRDNSWPKQLRRAIEDAQSASDPGHDDEEHTLLPL